MPKRLKLQIFSIVGLFLIIAIVLFWPYYRFLKQTLHVSVLKTLLSLDSLKTYDHQVNIAILGISGPGHDGPNLSDTIIVANYNFQTNKLTTISVPRDIWSDTLKDKVNSAYAYGEAKEPGRGGYILAKAEIGAVVGIPIQYVAVIDFEKFTELIDFFGGIDVNIEHSFVDNQFPIAGKEEDLCGGDPDYKCRYMTISFKQGITHMNGDTSLNFVRSRHAEGDEGSDFAREARQQRVIDAVKVKLVTLAKTGNISSYEKLFNMVDKLVRRDITNQQAAIIAKDIVLKGHFSQNKALISQDFFNVPPYVPQFDQKWVLLPLTGDFNQIHGYVQCILQTPDVCEKLVPTPTPSE